MENPRKLVHVSRIPIRWGDMDAYGHVNNTVFFRFMEQCRVEYLERLGYRVAPLDTAPVIINAACTFLAQLNYPGTVEVRMYFGAPGRSSIPSSYEIRLEGDDTLYATGDSKIVWMDVATGRSVPIPEALRAELEA